MTGARTRSNIVYNEKKGYLSLGPAQEERSFMNTAQSKRFMQTVAIAAKCHKFVNENLHTTIRGLYYQLKYSLGEDVDENIFNEQAESNPLIEDLEVALRSKERGPQPKRKQEGRACRQHENNGHLRQREAGNRCQQDGKKRLGDTKRC